MVTVGQREKYSICAASCRDSQSSEKAPEVVFQKWDLDVERGVGKTKWYPTDGVCMRKVPHKHYRYESTVGTLSQ